MAKEEVCYTREVALEKAIEMEDNSFQVYKDAYFKVRDRQAKDLVRDLALDELRHRYTLEKAFFEESVALHDTGMDAGPSMKLSLLLQAKPLDEKASDQDVMIHAIHDEKQAVDFYRGLMEQCGGAPMEGLFRQLYEEETDHLARLETLYESIYMREM